MSHGGPREPQPLPGDVLITSESGLFRISVAPYPHRLSFKELSDAISIAKEWAAANQSGVWRRTSNALSRLEEDARETA